MGIDPTDFRRKNVLRQGESALRGNPPMDADYLDTMDKAAAAIN
jgi:CO/xanthine dehydrogenase Mo-binding subunit